MPELPEVETICAGLSGVICNEKILSATVRTKQLRWPVSASLSQRVKNQRITAVGRRGKYLLLHLQQGAALIIHLGMSGHLKFSAEPPAAGAHDHVDLVLTNGLLRYHDPRRFGAVLWSAAPFEHKLLAKLGVEPLSADFTGEYLYNLARSRKLNIKNYIMSQAIVVGVGNIYASEALFSARINPLTPANTLTVADYKRLVTAIKKILKQAIKQGGTTLKDFFGHDGKPGYFANKLKIYNLDGSPCGNCGNIIQKIILGQRGTFFCAHCQPLPS